MRAELLAEKEGRDTENVNAAKMAEDRQSIVVFFFGAYVVSRKFRAGSVLIGEFTGHLNGNLWLKMEHFRGDLQ